MGLPFVLFRFLSTIGLKIWDLDAYANLGVAALATKKPTLASIWSEKGVFGGLFVLGEVLYILRPLIYVLSIRKYGVHSWIPWLLSLTVDVTGMGILSHVTNAGFIRRENSIPLSAAEKDEVCLIYSQFFYKNL